MNKLNISIDDVSPHPLSSTKVLKSCEKIIQRFPDVKISLFVPASYWRTVRQGVITNMPLQIDLPLFKDFCEEIKNLDDKNFELCYHGFYHGIPGENDNNEFMYFNKKEATDRYNLIFQIIDSAGLKDKFKMVFRPPGWSISKESIQAARELGFKVLALNPEKKYKERSSFEDEKGKDVVYMTAAPPFFPLEVLPKTEIVYHACEWDKNYLGPELTDNLIKFLEENEGKYQFAFIEDLLT